MPFIVVYLEALQPLVHINSVFLAVESEAAVFEPPVEARRDGGAGVEGQAEDVEEDEEGGEGDEQWACEAAAGSGHGIALDGPD